MHLEGEPHYGDDWGDDDGADTDPEWSAEAKRLEDAIGGPQKLDALRRTRPDKWLAFRLFDVAGLRAFLVRAPAGDLAIFALVLDDHEYEVEELRCVQGGDEFLAFTTKKSFSRLRVRRDGELLAMLNRPMNLPFNMPQRRFPAVDRELHIEDYSSL